jgi:O-antigen/teichoic acid export membrane protein
LYAPASRIQDAISIVPAAIVGIGFPFVAQTSAAGTASDAQRLLGRLAGIGFCIAVPVALGASLLVGPVLTTVLGTGYAGAALPTKILIWSLPISALCAPLLAGLAGIGHGGDTTRVCLSAFAVALSLHFALDWWLGATGGAIASFAREPAALAVTFVLARRAGLVPDQRPQLTALRRRLSP